MIAYDINGRSYSLNESNLGGGEGKLYSVANHPELYAKIFKEEKRTRGREAKILEWEYMFEARILVIRLLFLESVYIHRKVVRTFKRFWDI